MEEGGMDRQMDKVWSLTFLLGFVMGWTVPPPKRQAEVLILGICECDFIWKKDHYSCYRACQVALVVKNPPASAGDIRNVGSVAG